MVTHAETRKKSLVDKFYRLGLCISYDRLMQISTDLGNKVSEQFEKDGLVCPLDLRKDLFTTGCVDNIDHDPSSRTAKHSFHGTAISITQHPTVDSQGVKRGKVVLVELSQIFLIHIPISHHLIVLQRKTYLSLKDKVDVNPSVALQMRVCKMSTIG